MNENTLNKTSNVEIASNEEIAAISKRLIEKNRVAYEVLAQ